MLPPQQPRGEEPLTLVTATAEITCPNVPGHRTVLVLPPTPNVPAPIVKNRCKCTVTHDYYEAVVVAALYRWCAQAAATVCDDSDPVTGAPGSHYGLQRTERTEDRAEARIEALR